MEKKPHEREYYVVIDGCKITVSYEVEKELRKNVSWERNRARQRHSCGQNDFHKCFGDCLCCPWNREGMVTPIGFLHHDYFASMASSEDVEQIVLQRIIIESIYAFADCKVPHGAELLCKHFDEQKPLRIIALEMNLPLTIVVRRLNLLTQLLRSNREKFI